MRVIPEPCCIHLHYNEDKTLQMCHEAMNGICLEGRGTFHLY